MVSLWSDFGSEKHFEKKIMSIYKNQLSNITLFITYYVIETFEFKVSELFCIRCVFTLLVCLKLCYPLS